MEQILQQLKDLLVPLFLQALPTTVLVFLLFFFLRAAFWKPFEQVLAQRQAATAGARKEAERLLTAAEEKLREYEESLRHARAEIYREQQAHRQAALQERSQLLEQARQQAAENLRRAKGEIARAVESAKKDLESESQRLGEEIARALLAPGSGR